MVWIDRDIEFSRLKNAQNGYNDRRAVFEKAADIYAKVYPGPQGGIVATFEIIVLTGWAPDASQPQPLRPGSATARLADALGTDETSLPD